MLGSKNPGLLDYKAGRFDVGVYYSDGLRSIFLAGLSILLIQFFALYESNTAPPPRFMEMMVGILLLLGAVPLALLWRLQSIVRTRGRAFLAGAACGLGATSFYYIAVLGNASFAYWRGVFIASVAAMTLYGLLSLALISVLNRVRPPLPVQNGTLCPNCAYSLVGNTSRVYPECGQRYWPSQLRA